MPLEEYLVGVVGAEMPASFGIEALKSQAVAARTYTFKRLYTQPKHPDGAQMCDDIRCCQAYISPEKYKKQFGNGLYDNRFIPVSKAVADTQGEVITYQNKLVDTPYFSTCGGRTASAQEVWGKEVLYLHSVKCEYCKQSKRYDNENRISLTQLNQALQRPSASKVSYEPLAVTASGRLKVAKIGEQKVSGQELRRLFDLPSTRITRVKQQGKQVIFYSRGYGHGVGLCQYGAAGMGQKGYSYREIIKHYYQGVSITRLKY